MGKNPKIKKPIYKKWWFWVLIAIFVGAAGSGLSGSDESAEPSTSQTGTQDPVSTQEVTPTEPAQEQDDAEKDEDPPAVEDTADPDFANNEAEDSLKFEDEDNGEDTEYTLDLDTVAMLCRLALSQNFGDEHYDLEYDDTGMTINFWMDNIALGAAAAANGDESAKESWDVLVDSQKTLCNSFAEQAKEAAGEGYIVMLNVLNDMDKSKTLLSVVNGTVVYDSVNS